MDGNVTPECTHGWSDKRRDSVGSRRRQRPLEAQMLLYAQVLELRKKSFSYSKIIAEIKRQSCVTLSKSCVSNWVNKRHIPLGRAYGFEPKHVPELAYVIGVEAGDGSLNSKRYSYRIRLKATDRDFVEEFDRCLSSILGSSRHRLWTGDNTNEFQLEVGSYLLYRFLRKPLEELKPWIEHDTSCVSAFIRGFFDSEGSITRQGALTASNTNLDLLRYVQWLLTKFLGIETTGPHLGKRKGTVLARRGKVYLRKSDCYSIYVRRACLDMFRQIVGFSLERKQLVLDNVLATNEIH